MSDALTREQVDERLLTAPRWRVENGRLVRDYQLADFPAAMAFVNQVAALANAMDHHPEIHIDWGTVTLTLVSHDVDGISERDLALAHAVDTLAGES